MQMMILLQAAEDHTWHWLTNKEVLLTLQLMSLLGLSFRVSDPAWRLPNLEECAPFSLPMPLSKLIVEPDRHLLRFDISNIRPLQTRRQSQPF